MVGAALLVAGPLTGCAGTHLPAVAANSSAAPPVPCSNSGTAYARTELFFGKSIPGGGTVTDASFAQFLDREVTPRFPAGFTVVPALGQYRETNGVIDHEASDMLIVFYPQDSARDASTKIDEIRTAYDKTFHQESVLREDEHPSCVLF
ncbi:MAG: DUF3574 domain-containing protein [Pseudonocardiales bacterium]|nr:DUF3574 domain-containing protein [Pseudonocardiales bacterium]